MKQLNLEQMGVQEMDAVEVHETNGGLFGLDDLIVGIAVGAAIAIINDWNKIC